MSGEHFFVSSLSLWTVVGFPKPQQFQLKTTKEEADEGWENPVGDFPSAQEVAPSLVLVATRVLIDYFCLFCGGEGPVMHGENHASRARGLVGLAFSSLS